jgi:hypothetical protein
VKKIINLKKKKSFINVWIDHKIFVFKKKNKLSLEKKNFLKKQGF